MRSFLSCIRNNNLGIEAEIFYSLRLKSTLIKRRFFTKSRNFFEKRSKLSDQAFAKKCCAAILVLKVSQNLRRQTELL